MCPALQASNCTSAAEAWRREGCCGVAGRHPRATAGSDSDLLVAIAATTVMIVLVVVIAVVAALLVMIVTAIANRPQEVIEGLRRDASPLPPRRRVREAEMNPHVDASFDYLVGQI
jgi:hypothetical protein